MSDPQPGRYRHYKGHDYAVLGMARHSESQDELVLYRQEYGDHSLWVRPKEMFLETVKIDGRDIPRFQYLGAEPANEASAGNLFSNIPLSLPDELIESALSRPNVRIERIVSHGHSSPDGFWYDQTEHEFIVVLQGAARLRFDDGEIELKPGSFIDIPAHKRHRVEWTTPNELTIWLAIHYGAICARV
jgi:cupin 2 domain-containing protein